MNIRQWRSWERIRQSFILIAEKNHIYLALYGECNGLAIEESLIRREFKSRQRQSVIFRQFIHIALCLLLLVRGMMMQLRVMQ